MPDSIECAPPPPAAYRFVRELSASMTADDDRRADMRVAAAATLRVQPLNRQLTATGEPFSAVLYDLSASGISLVHTRAVLHEFLWIDFSEPARALPRLLIRVLRCKLHGRFYIIAGRVVLKNPLTQSSAQ